MFKHIIIGGGVTGASIAYHLSKITRGRIALIEKNTLGSGQTAQSAGLLLHHHSSPLGKRMAKQTSIDIHHLKKKHTIEHHQTGSVYLHESQSISPPYSYKNKYIRIPTREIVRQTTQDSYVNPHDLVSAYLHDARHHGSVLLEHTNVLNLHKKHPNMVKVQTDKGTFLGEHIINATGYESPQFSPLPITNLRSHYWIAKASSGQPILLNARRKHNRYWMTPSSVPILLVPGMYIRVYGDQMDIGIQEKESKMIHGLSPHNADDILLHHIDTLKKYIIDIDNLHIQHYVSGASSYTPDGLPVIRRGGRVTSISGCCGYGLTWAGGIGQMVASREIPAELCATRFDHLSESTLQKMALDIRHNKFK